jgi:uncharacterized membrane protein YhaH (DUF805 family)
MRDSIVRGFTGILRFSGRDTRSEFWPYAAAAVALYLVVGMPVGAVLALPVTVDSTSFNPGAFLNTANQFILFSLIMFAALVALLAAAVARRLRDAGQSAFWGLLPLSFVAFGVAVFLRLLSQVGLGNSDRGLFFVGFVNNLLYLVAVAWLIALLVRRSKTK